MRSIRLFFACALLSLLPAVAASGEPKRYRDVIPRDAVTTHGLFTVHRVKNRVYYEIPVSRLGRDMLWYGEVAKAPAGISCGGSAIGSRSLRWERVHDRILLRQTSFDKQADSEEKEAPLAVRRAVENSSLPPIIMSFEIETEGKDGAAVIDVTKLLTSDVDEFSVEKIFRQAGVTVSGERSKPDSSRSYVDDVKAFPENIEVRSVLTFRTTSPSSVPGNLRSASVLVHYSMTLLPERPMRPRLWDPRVGYFASSHEYYSKGESKVVIRRYIDRFRLEKKDPAAAVSEPIKPIVFYLGREVPEKWRPYIRQGVEDWQPALEAAGFRRAIVARDAPSEAENPLWDPEDTRYSVIRWGAVPVANAIGPHVYDPRSGEVLSGRVVIYQDILKLAEQWYFSMCAPLDPRAQKLPFPDDLKGEILRYIVGHEIGHTLGLRHNHKASSAFTVAELRDPHFTSRYGTVASIMSYGRFNYVAQPGDGVSELIPRIGPYDVFAIEWGYKPLPEATSPAAEKPLLDVMAARQIDEPWLRFGGEDGPALVDPTVKTQSIGADPVETTRLGLKNLERAVELLLPATSRLGEDFEELKEAYYSLLDTRQSWLTTVVDVIGGVEETRTLAGRGGDQFSRAPKEKQREALRFVLEEGFSAPSCLVRPDILNKFRYLGIADPIMRRERELLEELLSAKRYKLLEDAETLDPVDGYSLAEFFADVQDGLFEELGTKQPVVNVYRRELHRSYLAHLKAQLTPAETPAPRTGTSGAARPRTDSPVSPVDTDFVAVARGSLGKLGKRIEAALPRVKDDRTHMHFQEFLREIDLLLGNGSRSGPQPGSRAPVALQ